MPRFLTSFSAPAGVQNLLPTHSQGFNDLTLLHHQAQREAQRAGSHKLVVREPEFAAVARNHDISTPPGLWDEAFRLYQMSGSSPEGPYVIGFVDGDVMTLCPVQVRLRAGLERDRKLADLLAEDIALWRDWTCAQYLHLDEMALAEDSALIPAWAAYRSFSQALQAPMADAISKAAILHLSKSVQNWRAIGSVTITTFSRRKQADGTLALPSIDITLCDVPAPLSAFSREFNTLETYLMQYLGTAEFPVPAEMQVAQRLSETKTRFNTRLRLCESRFDLSKMSFHELRRIDANAHPRTHRVAQDAAL